MLVADDSGAVVTEECMLFCAPGARAECDHPECCCDCHTRSLDRSPNGREKHEPTVGAA